MSEINLPSSIQAAWQRALDAGELQPIETRSVVVADGGVPFRVFYAPHLAHKPKVAAGSAPVNPFLPYNPRLLVAPLSDTHVALLNKFPVVAHHVLIVTREFERQELALTAEDFKALASVMRPFASLGFYNSGQVAGASQPHRHLQVIPMPLVEGDQGVPIESLLQCQSMASDGVQQCPRIPFTHRCVSLHPEVDPEMMWHAYQQLLSSLGWTTPEPPPYNLLVAHQWMMIVPRRQECFGQISLNAMAYAGSLFAKNAQQLDQLREAGPLRALIECADP